MLNRRVWSRYIKLTADTFSTYFCLERCNWGTMKSLGIKIASFCELFQNRFYFKDLRCELSGWTVRKFWNFWFHCIINMKNNYHQTFAEIVRLIILIRNGKIVWKHGPYCWYFRLNLKYLGWSYRAYIKTAKIATFARNCSVKMTFRLF